MKLKLLLGSMLVVSLFGCGSISGPSKPEPSSVTAALDKFAKQHDPGNALDVTRSESSTSGRLISLELSHKGFRYKGETGDTVNIPPGSGSASIFNRDGKWVLDHVTIKAPDGTFRDFEPKTEVK
ncbi:MAG TPA: hypothetical protein PKD24_06135 [Pyrinomonadaceae bacterium]|nr:hypothetical protein [Pyrinomonadaceae bacterium]HMP65265.1 hypothetical protein [Pyrinomonadaceae bacterium]